MYIHDNLSLGGIGRWDQQKRSVLTSFRLIKIKGVGLRDVNSLQKIGHLFN